MKVGQLLVKKQAVVVHGGVVKAGDKIYYHGYRDGDVYEDRIDRITCEMSRNISTGEKDPWCVRIHTQYRVHSPNACFASEVLARSVTIANGKTATIGSTVWLWRNAKSPQPALVRKKVVAVYQRRRWVQCTYEDNLWPYGEPAEECYATEQEALDAHPDLAAALEVALMRAGRRQGQRVRLAA